MTTAFDVNEEYRNAIPTRSFVEFWARVHRREISRYIVRPSDYDFLLAALPDSELRALFRDFFVAGELACSICISLLSSVDRLRRDHQMLHSLYNQTSYKDLASYVGMENPLSRINFNQIHNLYEALLQKLNITRASIGRRVRHRRRCKLAIGVTFVVAGGVVAAAALAIAPHMAISVIVAGVPVLVLSVARRLRRRRAIFRCRHLARKLAQTEAAARGAYILNRDMETISRIAARLKDEVDHRKRVVMLFLRCREKWLLAEAVGGGAGLLERAGELEEHVYWCIITIKRTWATLASELVLGACSSPTT